MTGIAFANPSPNFKNCVRPDILPINPNVLVTVLPILAITLPKVLVISLIASNPLVAVAEVNIPRIASPILLKISPTLPIIPSLPPAPPGPPFEPRIPARALLLNQLDANCYYLHISNPFCSGVLLILLIKSPFTYRGRGINE